MSNNNHLSNIMTVSGNHIKYRIPIGIQAVFAQRVDILYLKIY